MNKKMSKRQRDIKSKLMAAICMLLVSSIMMVSTTYAWFTLSTAPEVTGITTAVGANGNLEMALLPVNGEVIGAGKDYGIATGTSDSMANQAANLANVTWGNLVDLEQYYGLEKIVLQPTALNLPRDASTNEVTAYSVQEAMPLAFPQYGSDGRISQLSSATLTGVYHPVDDQFLQTGLAKDAATGEDVEVADPQGVRVIGAISGMSPRQQAQREALNSATTAISAATGKAGQTLRTNGPALAAVAIEHAMDKSHNKDDIAPMIAIVDDLNTALASVEDAYRWYIYAYEIANDATGYEAKKAGIVGAEAAELDALQETYASVDALADVVGEGGYIDKLQASMAKINYALDGTDGSSGLNALKDATGAIDWEDISKPLAYIADVGGMYVNGIPAGELGMDNAPGLVLGGNVTLTLKSGSGIFADIAEHCGDYGAGIDIPLSLVGMGEDTDILPATMKTEVNSTTMYLNKTKAIATRTEIVDTGDTDAKPISDYYGYIIDLAFRTNAADSYLKLQTEGVDRIYTDGTQNESTMGGGSTMTFQTLDANFSAESMKKLMQHIRVVFFNPEKTDGDNIIAYGVMDPEEAEVGTNVVGKLRLATRPKATDEGYELITTSKLMDLEQNKAHRLSVLVYLDGETITNADVAIGAGQSMFGALNLQFASSATLTPMQYTDLIDASTNTGITPLTGATVNGGTEGYTAEVLHHVSGSIGARITKDGEEINGTNATVKIKADVASAEEGVEPETVEKDAAFTTLDGGKGWVANGFGTDPEKISNVVITVNPKAVVEEPEGGGDNDDNENEDDDNENIETPAEFNVTVPEGATGDPKATEGEPYTFTVKEGYTLDTVTVGGDEVVYTENEGAYTIAGENVTDDIVITVTPNEPVQD